MCILCWLPCYIQEVQSLTSQVHSWRGICLESQLDLMMCCRRTLDSEMTLESVKALGYWGRAEYTPHGRRTWISGWGQEDRGSQTGCVLPVNLHTRVVPPGPQNGNIFENKFSQEVMGGRQFTGVGHYLIILVS